jgi:DNA-binding transcriptional regulator YbjK
MNAPGPTSDPTTSAEQRRRAILEATLRVIAAEGVEVVTHRRVAAEAAVPLGSTTYYFDSRDGLVREAFRHYVARTLAALQALGSEQPSETVDDLVGFLVEVVRHEAADPAVILLEYELILRAARDPVLAREVQAYERSLAGPLAEVIERFGVARPFDAARTLIALVRGFELESLHRAAVDPADLRRRLLPVARALLADRRGVTGAPRRPGRARRSTRVTRTTNPRRRVR